MSKAWELKGKYLESCRVEGHCPLWFGRDLWNDKPCVNFETRIISEGNIGGVDVKGIIIVQHQDGIGPKAADLGKPGGISEGAFYISETATKEQREALEPFVRNQFGKLWGKCLGVKFVDIKVEEGESTYHVRMPFGEQKITLSVGGDGKTPVGMTNSPNPVLSNVCFANTDIWSFRDYGKNIEYHNTEGNVADFHMAG